MFNKNAIWLGILLGLAIPFVGYALLLTLFEQMEVWGVVSKEGFSEGFRKRTLTVIAICFNVIPFNYYQKNDMIQTMRGLVFPTAIYAIAWIITFGQEIF